MEILGDKLLEIREEYQKLKQGPIKTGSSYVKLQVRCYAIETQVDAIDLHKITDTVQRQLLHSLRKLMLQRLSDMEICLKKRY